MPLASSLSQSGARLSKALRVNDIAPTPRLNPRFRSTQCAGSGNSFFCFHPRAFNVGNAADRVRGDWVCDISSKRRTARSLIDGWAARFIFENRQPFCQTFSCDPAVATPSMVGFYSPRAQQQIADGHRILAPVDKMHFTRAVALAHLPANQPWAILRGPDWIVGITKVEQKRRAPRPVIAPKKRVTRKVEDLSRLLSELQRLREQVQRAEAGRRLN